MKHSRDLNACIADLSAMKRGDRLNPKQKKDVESAIECVRWVRRHPEADRSKLYGAVRQIASLLADAFIKGE